MNNKYLYIFSLYLLLFGNAWGQEINTQEIKAVDMYQKIKMAAENGGEHLESLRDYMLNSEDMKLKKIILNQEDQTLQNSPYTNFLIEGFIDPHFDEVLEILKKLDEKFDHFTDGPTLEEGAENPVLMSLTGALDYLTLSNSEQGVNGLNPINQYYCSQDDTSPISSSSANIQQMPPSQMRTTVPSPLHDVLDFAQKLNHFIATQPMSTRSDGSVLWGRDDTDQDFKAGGRENRDGRLTESEAKLLNQLMNRSESSLSHLEKQTFKQLRKKLTEIS